MDTGPRAKWAQGGSQNGVGTWNPCRNLEMRVEMAPSRKGSVSSGNAGTGELTDVGAALFEVFDARMPTNNLCSEGFLDLATLT